MSQDPDCPYHVRLHPDERCTCTPSVNAPVLAEQSACNGRLNMCKCHQPVPPSKFIRARWEEGCCSFCKPDPMRELEREITEFETAASFTGWMPIALRIRVAFDRLRVTADPSPRR